MKYSPRAFGGWLAKKLGAQFVAGIVVVVPIGVTFLILLWIFNVIDNVLQPIISSYWGHTIPGTGFVITIVLVYLAGVIATNIVGRRLIRYGESLLARMPVIRELYTGIKDILESFSARGKTSFMQVVLVEFPRKGIKAVGFVTNESTDKSGKKLLNVLIPTAPNPTTGFLLIVREDEVIRTNISVENAVKMFVSAGRVSPEEISDKLSMSS